MKNNNKNLEEIEIIQQRIKRYQRFLPFLKTIKYFILIMFAFTMLVNLNYKLHSYEWYENHQTLTTYAGTLFWFWWVYLLPLPLIKHLIKNNRQEISRLQKLI